MEGEDRRARGQPLSDAALEQAMQAMRVSQQFPTVAFRDSMGCLDLDRVWDGCLEAQARLPGQEAAVARLQGCVAAEQAHDVLSLESFNGLRATLHPASIHSFPQVIKQV